MNLRASAVRVLIAALLLTTGSPAGGRPAGAATPQAAPEIAVLLRAHAGRDADLGRRSLAMDQLEALERRAGTRLVPLGVLGDGAQHLLLPDVRGAATVAMVLAKLRTEPSLLYADHFVPLPANRKPLPGEAEQRLDRIILQFRDKALRDRADRGEKLPKAEIARLVVAAGAPVWVKGPVAGGAWELRLQSGRTPISSVRATAERLAALPSVSWAEPAVRGRFELRPDDTLLPDQWPLDDDTAGIRALQAWEATTGSPTVTVAVLDSGVRTEHPDLAGRLLPGYDFVSDGWRANDPAGRDADASDPGDRASRGECGLQAPATESTWHGTHVAGTIGAATNNGTGIAGVDWQARILPVRVGAKCGIDPIDLADAIRWAAGALPETEGSSASSLLPPQPYPADVLNLSIAFPGACPPYMQDAINAALAAGALPVVAAGNQGQPAANVFPANCRGVLSVYATGRHGQRTPYSNFGRVHLAAPGGDSGSWAADGILSLANDGSSTAGADDYGYKVGTSMAAPHVAGVASLVLATQPGMTPGALMNRLIETARPFPAAGSETCQAGGERSCGAGILDAAAAVAAR